MSKKSNKGKGLVVVGVIVLVGAAGFVGWLWGNDWMFSSNPKQITPEIDGVINKREWARSSYTIPFYLDVDNDVDTTVGIANVDGWNYMHVAEDENFYYVALDLCSDRTNNIDGEWIAFQLANRLPDTEGSKLAFYALEDFGYEYFFYNVSDDTVFSHEYNPGPPGVTNFGDIPIFPEADSFEVLRGKEANGDLYDMWTDWDDNNFTIKSEYYLADGSFLAGDFIAVHFGVNITEKFPDEEISTFLSSMTDMDLRLTLKSNLTANNVGHFGVADEYFFAITEHGAMPGNMSSGFFLSDYNVYDFSANTTSIAPDIDLNYLNINASTGMFYFSIYAWNDPDISDPTAYEIEIDKMSLIFQTERVDSIVGNTIETGNYDIAYTYGSSENCAENHRMFEFKIAKSEFPVLDDEMLYVSVGGYGTMALVDSNYWLYPMFGYPLSPIDSSHDEYLDFLPLDMSIA